MLTISDLKPGVYFIMDDQPYEVVETHHLKMQQRRPVLQTKMKNLSTGKTFERNFQQSDTFQEAEIDRKSVKFIYSHRGENWFSVTNEPSKRFKLKENITGEMAKFLKPNLVIDAIFFNGEIINIKLPIKMDFKVIEAPPAIKGNTAQGGVKQITIETGTKINVPLFINKGDMIRINTQTGEYTERVYKK